MKNYYRPYRLVEEIKEEEIDDTIKMSCKMTLGKKDNLSTIETDVVFSREGYDKEAVKRLLMFKAKDTLLTIVGNELVDDMIKATEKAGVEMGSFPKNIINRQEEIADISEELDKEYEKLEKNEYYLKEIVS